MKKINYHLLGISLFCVVAWFLITQELLKNRYVRLNGDLINVEIVDLRYVKGIQNATIEIQGVRMDAGSLIGDQNKRGDILLVRYVQGIDTVVQERMNPNRYYIYLGVASLLLIAGVALLIESLKGKKIWG